MSAAMTMEPEAGRAGGRVGPADWRALGPWYVVELLNGYGYTLFTLGAYWYASRVLHAPAANCLWLAAGLGFTCIFFALLGGRWAERWGPRRLVLRMAVLGVLTAGLGLGVMWWGPMRNAWGLMAAMIAYNFNSTLMWPPLESALSRAKSSLSLTTRMMIYNLVWSGAAFAAFFTEGAIVQHLGWMWVFALPGLCMAGAAGMVAGCIGVEDDAGTRERGDAEQEDGEADRPELTTRATRLLYMAWLANAMAYVAITVLNPLMPTLSDKAGVGSLAATGLFQSPWALLRFVGFIIVWRWTRWHYSVRWMLGAYLGLAGGFAVMLLCPANLGVFMAGQVVFGLATALIYCSSLYYAMHVSQGAGGHAGLHEALVGVGIAVGPMAGALAGTGTEALPSITLAVSGVLAAGFVGLAVMGARAGKSRREGTAV